MAKAKALDIKKWLAVGAAGALAWLCIHKKNGVSGIGYSRSRTPEEERPILNLIYYGKDKEGHDVYIRRTGRFVQYITDVSNKFRTDENAVFDLYFSYPGYKVDPYEWDIYRDEHDWNWHVNRDHWFATYEY